MNWFQRFMMGRYGSDQLNMGLLVLCCLITLAARISGWYFLVFFSYLPLLYALFRMFSRKIEKRRAENLRFMKSWTPIRQWIVRRFQRLRQCRQYRFYRCPSCRATVRVPRGKGKIEIHCPNCGNRFVKKS